VHTTDPYERLALDRALSAIEEASRKIAVEAILKHGPGQKGVADWATAKGELLVRTLATIQGLITGPLNQAKLTVLGGLLGDLVRD
jgi:glutamate dehydrogenase